MAFLYQKIYATKERVFKKGKFFLKKKGQKGCFYLFVEGL